MSYSNNEMQEDAKLSLLKAFSRGREEGVWRIRKIVLDNWNNSKSPACKRALDRVLKQIREVK